MFNTKRSGRTISHVDDLPETTQFAVIVDSSYSEAPTSVIGFDTEAQLLEWVKKNDESHSKKSFLVLPYKPLKIQKQLSISVS